MISKEQREMMFKFLYSEGIHKSPSLQYNEEVLYLMWNHMLKMLKVSNENVTSLGDEIEWLNSKIFDIAKSGGSGGETKDYGKELYLLAVSQELNPGEEVDAFRAYFAKDQDPETDPSETLLKVCQTCGSNATKIIIQPELRCNVCQYWPPEQIKATKETMDFFRNKDGE